MKPLIICLSILSALPVSIKAENPVMLGLRGALNVSSPVPAETSHTVRSKAAELLARYVKLRNGSSFAERKSGENRMWMEMKGLQLTRVTAKAVSQADQANGTLESYLVSVDCEMYRTYDTAAAKWSNWNNGGNPLMPAVIHVERQTAGQWIARIPEYPTLIAQYAKGDPNTIPHGIRPAQKAARILTSAPQPASVSNDSAAPATGKPITTTAEHPGSWRGTIVLLTIIAAFSAFLNSIKFKKGSGKRSKAGRSGKTTPPPFNSQAASSQPPPLPPLLPADELAYPDIDLMKGNSHLLTPAEQAFHKVLEPLVRNACAISSKVRLADLFSVTPGRGQQAAFNKISRKHIDFVLTEPSTSRILCAIELDDSSHNRPDRIERDDFVNELFAVHGMPLLRVPVAWTYYPQALRAELLKAGVVLSSAA